MKDEIKVLNFIFEFFIKSNDFNGISLSSISEKLGIKYSDLVGLLKILVEESKIWRNGHILGSKPCYVL